MPVILAVTDVVVVFVSCNCNKLDALTTNGSTFVVDIETNPFAKVVFILRSFTSKCVVFLLNTTP